MKITRSFHTEWCGLQTPDGDHIYLPILTEEELRRFATDAGLVLLELSGVSVECPGRHLHIQPNGVDDCVVTDECGLPRLRCRNSGCRYLCHATDWAMRSLYLNVLQKAESSGVPIISHEALLTLEHVFAFFPVPREGGCGS